MSYLSSHAFVHRDLAARNCLIADQGMVKISDFSGLCDMYAGDYYRAPGRPPLPVRWMSPEAISQMNFSAASDVWSFGVLLWEIFSYGSRPFFGLSNYQAMEHILDNELLPSPDRCPVSIFEIITACWLVDMDERITFSEIYNKLKAMSETVSSLLSASSTNKLYLKQQQQYSPESHHRNNHEQDMPLLPDDMDSGVMHSPVLSRTPSSIRKHHHSHHLQRDVPPGSYRSSLHSRHSSNPSVHSVGYHHGAPSIHSSSMASSLQPRSNHAHHNHNTHSMSRQQQAPPSTRSSNHHHSLPRDGFRSLGRSNSSDHHSHSNSNYMSPHNNQFPMHNMNHNQPSDHRSTISSSIASSHRMHPMGAYSTPSYPPSVTGPPASSVFSRQSSSHPSSKTSGSIKSYESSQHQSRAIPPLHHHSNGYHHSNGTGGHHHGNGNAQVYL